MPADRIELDRPSTVVAALESARLGRLQRIAEPDPREIIREVDRFEPSPRLDDRDPKRIDPFVAAPGTIPFADFLEARNRIDRAADAIPAELPPPPPPADSPRPRQSGPNPFPSLGAAPPVDEPVIRRVLEERYLIESPWRTGSIIDLVL